MRARGVEAGYRGAEPDARVACACVAARGIAGCDGEAARVPEVGEPCSGAGFAYCPFAEACFAGAGGACCGGALQGNWDYTRAAFCYGAARGVCGH